MRVARPRRAWGFEELLPQRAGERSPASGNRFVPDADYVRRPSPDIYLLAPGGEENRRHLRHCALSQSRLWFDRKLSLAPPPRPISDNRPRKSETPKPNS